MVSGLSAQRDANLRARINRWRDAFRDDTTGIHRTLDDLIWKYAAFRTAIRIVKLAEAKRTGEPQLNQMLFDLIADGYWANFLLGIRRLLDGSSALNGKRGVYSLRSVIKDIEVCRSQITRRVYVEWVCDADFDPARLRTEHDAALRAAARERKGVWTDPALRKSAASHSQFDVLSGVLEADRQANDVIDGAIFLRVEARLAKLDVIADYVSSHIAHAGNTESRQGKALDEFDIRDARAALMELKAVADLVGMWFADAGGAGLATYIGDQFEGLEKPLIAPFERTDLEEQWKEIDRDVATWSLAVADL
jgi:hypothetical protein